jgi:restriction endonuclease S subunit
MVRLGDVCEIERGASPRPIKNFITNDANGVNWIKIGDGSPSSMYIEKTEEKITKEGAKKSRHVKGGDLILSNSMSFGHPYILRIDGCIHDGWLALRDINNKIDKEFLYYLLSSAKIYKQFEQLATGGVVNNLNSNLVRGVLIPFPPLEIQQEIAAKIEGYQKVIDGARQVVENWKPQIEIDPEWPMVKLGDVCEVTSSKRIFQDEYVNDGVPFYRTKEIVEFSQGKETSLSLFISKKKYTNIKNKFPVPKFGDILISAVGTIGITWIIPDDREFYFKDGNLLWLREFKNANPEFIKLILDKVVSNNLHMLTNGAAYNAMTIEKLKILNVLLPPLATQQEIVAKIEAERKIIDGCRELIVKYEEKIKKVVDGVWGE